MTWFGPHMAQCVNNDLQTLRGRGFHGLYPTLGYDNRMIYDRWNRERGGWYACTTSALIPRWQLCPHERPPGTVVCFRVNSVPCLGSLTYHPASSIAAWSCAIDLLPTRGGSPYSSHSWFTLYSWEEGLDLPECIGRCPNPACIALSIGFSRATGGGFACQPYSYLGRALRGRLSRHLGA